MATIAATITYPNVGLALITWTPIATGDAGAAVAVAEYADKTLHMTGSVGSATYVLQGSNDGTNWVTLTDPQGNALSFTATDKLELIAENPLYIRPSASGGAGGSATVAILARTLRS